MTNFTDTALDIAIELVTRSKAEAGGKTKKKANNLKQGWIVLALSAGTLLFWAVAANAQYLRWKTSGVARPGRKATRHLFVSALVAWIIIDLVLSFEDYHKGIAKQLSKRFGRLCFHMMPLDIVASMRPLPLPNVFYLEAIWFHKWFSRLIVLLAMAHTIGYLAIWGTGNTWDKMQKPLNYIGAIAMGFFLIATVVSLPVMRRWAYNFFYFTHVLMIWAVIFITKWHARPNADVAFWLCIALLAIQIIMKFVLTRSVQVEVLSQPGSDLNIIKMPNVFKDKMISGSHVRISRSRFNPVNYFLPSHPYTLVNTPDENTMKLIVKSENHHMKNQSKVSCFGPFPSTGAEFFRTAHNVVLVAGGVGVSYTLGLYQALLEKPSTNVRMVWVLRNRADLWILNHFRTGDSIDIYITNFTGNESSGGSSTDSTDEEIKVSSGSADEEIKAEDEKASDSATTGSVRSFIHGKPDWSKYNDFLTTPQAECGLGNNWVMSCGGSLLNADCRKWADSLGVNHHSEAFNM